MEAANTMQNKYENYLRYQSHDSSNPLHCVQLLADRTESYRNGGVQHSQEWFTRETKHFYPFYV